MAEFILLMGEYWRCASEIEAAGGFAQMPPEKIEALCLASARVRNHDGFRRWTLMRANNSMKYKLRWLE